jgi:hypothetical protein
MTVTEEKIAKIICLCGKKINDQLKRESAGGYCEDYTDGRVVGQAALARRILLIIRGCGE